MSLAAPGVDVLLPAINGRYTVRSGTSITAAHVSGAAALLLQQRPDLLSPALSAVLFATARDLGPPGPDPEYGAGLFDLLAALTAPSHTTASDEASSEQH